MWKHREPKVIWDCVCYPSYRKWKIFLDQETILWQFCAQCKGGWWENLLWAQQWLCSGEFSFSLSNLDVFVMFSGLGLRVAGQDTGAGVPWQGGQVHWCQQKCCPHRELWRHIQSEISWQFSEVIDKLISPRCGRNLIGAVSKPFLATVTASGTWNSITPPWSVTSYDISEVSVITGESCFQMLSSPGPGQVNSKSKVQLSVRDLIVQTDEKTDREK